MSFGISPANFPGNILWLDASVAAGNVFHDAGVTACTDGQTVQQWNDQSGIGFNFANATGANQPTWVASGINGWGSVHFVAASSQTLDGGNPGKLLNLTKCSYTIAGIIQVGTGQTLGSIFSKSNAGGGGVEKIWLAHVHGNPNYGNLDSLVNYQWFWSAVANAHQGVVTPGRPYLFIYEWALDQYEEDSGLINLPFGRHGFDLNNRRTPRRSCTDVTFNGTAHWRIGSDDLPAHFFDGYVGFMGMWPRLLSDAEKEQLVSYAAYNWGCKCEHNDMRRMTAFEDRSIRANVVCSGNSIQRGDNAYGQAWADLVKPNLLYPADVYNYGISGKTTANIISYDPYAAQTYYLPGRLNVAVLWEISNDLTTGIGSAAAYNNVVTWEANARAAGAGVTVVGTCLPRQNGTGIGVSAFETQRQAVNASLRLLYPYPTSDPLVFRNAAGNFLVDVGNDPTIGQAGDSTNATYYVDPHLTPAGQAIAEPYFRKALNRAMREDLLVSGGQVVHDTVSPNFGLVNDSSATTTVFKTSLGSTDRYTGRYVTWASDSANPGLVSRVSGYSYSNGVGTITLETAMPAAAAFGDQFFFGQLDTKSNYSLAPAQSFNLTGNLNGSVSGTVGGVTGSSGSSTGAPTLFIAGGGSLDFTTAGYTFDATPAATAYHGAAADGTFAITVAAQGAGWRLTGTVPGGYADGNSASIILSGTIGGITASVLACVVQVTPPVNTTQINGQAATALSPPISATLSGNQNFNIVGQTTALPFNGATVTLNTAVAGTAAPIGSAALDGQRVTWSSYYPVSQTWSASGVDSTGWTEFVFTCKARQTDVDSAALLVVRVSNPAAQGDGLLTFLGGAPGSAGDGSLSVTTTPASGDTPANTTVTLTLDATGASVPPGSYFWELTRYIGSAKYALGSGPLVLSPRLRQAAGQA